MSFLTYAGETLPVETWARRAGLDVRELVARLDSGWSIASALAVPARGVPSGELLTAVGARPCPVLKRHCGTNQAYVSFKLRGRRYQRYFGVWATPASRLGYRQFVRDWPALLLSGPGEPKPHPPRLLDVGGVRMDVKQFAGRGIPIYEELAKVVGKSVPELKDLVEQGRIGRDEVSQAFKNMTSAGGRFFEMTKRQAGTFKGQWEQMADAVELAKAKFGKALIDDLGLGDAAKGVERFAADVEGSIEHIRPALRTVRDLGEAAGNVAFQLARADFHRFGALFEGINQTFPGLAAEFRRLVDAAKEFRIDPRLAAREGLAVGEAIATGMAAAGRELADFATGVKRGIADPIIDAFDYARQSIQNMNDALPDGKGFLKYAIPIAQVALNPMGVIGRAAGPPPTAPPGRRDGDRLDLPFGPPVHGMSPDRIRAEWAALERGIQHAAKMAQGLPAGPVRDEFAKVQGDWEARKRDYLSGFTAPETAAADLNRGEVPPLVTTLSTRQKFDADFERTMKRLQVPAEHVHDSFRRLAAEMEAGWAAQDRAAAEQTRLTAEAARAAAEMDTFRRSVGALVPVAGLEASAAHRDTVSGMAIGGGVGALGQFGFKPLAPHMEEMGRDIRNRYDPMPEWERYRADLDELKKRGKITAGEHEMASQDKLKEIGGRFGVDAKQEYRLADAATVGTAEDARIVNQWRANGENGPATTETLLQLILKAIEAQTGIVARQPGPPRPVKMSEVNP